MGKIIMSMHRTLAIATAAVLVLLPPAAGQTAQPGTQVGILNCQMAPRTGLTVAVQSISCRFTPDGGYPQQVYLGEINTVGPEVGITTGGVLVWDVFASTSGPPAGGLAGAYLGANGGISVETEIGVNVLFGGSNRNLALRPVALEGEIEVALGLGISGLKLATAFQ
ncbi:DUF992 domain-containing protein [Bradyrhizobium sp.]|uniref:DUF992 domain-containing protein n=1 Tax=Bradyrhizobium sp. TaxID=376 RepID=UPI0025B9F9B5|nr:DUF992 domain-containing protein [Bradyrhizobium sp.]